jgi:hypothetical protein
MKALLCCFVFVMCFMLPELVSISGNNIVDTSVLAQAVAYGPSSLHSVPYTLGL